jgi:23S rRNA (adenine2503-C2)-methyltransferase
MTSTRDIRDLTFGELKRELAEWGEPGYRAGQLYDWLYRKGAGSFDELTDLPGALRRRLAENFSFGPLEVIERLVSKDRAEKFLFRLADGEMVETVVIPARTRTTLCLSTQVGCKFACGFCASGKGGFIRNLRPSEIVGQVLYFRGTLSLNLTNFVFMGMGEPLDNFNNVAASIRIMNAPEGLGIAARRITVSTAGVVPGIERLKSLGLQVNLSLSLHAGTDELRSRLMPINRKYPLARLLEACEDYVKATGRMMTIEYVLLRGVNDSAAEARRLGALARRLRAKVNLIPCSEIIGLNYKPSPNDRRELFLRMLGAMHIRVTLRRSKGADIRAACGQLAGRVKTQS